MPSVSSPASRSRRSDILAAAQREFAAAGYSGGRVERIAAAAAVNKQLLFHYFESKEGLFTTALEELLARCEPEATSGNLPADEIRGVLSGLQVSLSALPGLVAIVADAAANDGFPPAAAAAVHGWRTRLIHRLERAVVEGQRRGYFRDDIDPLGVASLAFAAALGTGALGESGGSVAVGGPLVDYCAWR